MWIHPYVCLEFILLHVNVANNVFNGSSYEFVVAEIAIFILFKAVGNCNRARAPSMSVQYDHVDTVERVYDFRTAWLIWSIYNPSHDALHTGALHKKFGIFATYKMLIYYAKPNCERCVLPRRLDAWQGGGHAIRICHTRNACPKPSQTSKTYDRGNIKQATSKQIQTPDKAQLLNKDRRKVHFRLFLDRYLKAGKRSCGMAEAIVRQKTP